MTSIHLLAADADARLAEEFAAALPRYARRVGKKVQVTRTGDPAAAAWVLLIASPDAARDEAVDRALTERVAARGVTDLQVVVVAGEWSWDQAAGRLDPSSTAAPRALHDAFPSEPRHLVYRGDRSADVSLRDVVFAEQVAEIVAPVVGTTKDEIFGEEVRQQRRTRRLTLATAIGLVVLLLGGIVGGALALGAAAAADRERDRAAAERDAADSRRLAALASQVASSDGSLARLLAVEAWRIARTDEAAAALEQAAMTSGAWEVGTTSVEVRRLIGHGGRPVDAALSEDRVATVDQQGVLRIWELGDGGSAVEVSGAFARSLAWSRDGAVLLAATGAQPRLYDGDGAPAGSVELELASQVAAPWGESGFVLGGSSVALVADGSVVVERTNAELDLAGPVSFVGGSADGERVLVGTVGGDVVVLDRDLTRVSAWRLEVAMDQLGERDSAEVLAWDGADRVVMPPDNAQVFGPVLGPQGPDTQDGAMAGVYDATTGEADGPIVDRPEIVPLPATAAAFLGDGVVALSPGGLEAPPSLGRRGLEQPLGEVPLPPLADLVRVSPDGAWLLVAGEDATANLLQVGDAGPGANSAGDSDAEAVAAACAAAGRNLSEPEWEVYLPDRAYRATCEEYDAPPAPVEPTGVPRVAAPPPDQPTPSAQPTASADSGEDPGGPMASGPVAIGPSDPFAGFDFANATYDLECFAEDEALVDGTATDRSGTLLELTGDRRRDHDGDGIEDAVVTFACTFVSGVSDITLVLDGAAPDARIELAESSTQR